MGSPGHLAGELPGEGVGADITHVPYKGGSPSTLAIMSGEAQLNFATLPAVVPQIRGGRVRAIGLASRERNPAVPDVPTMAELGVADFGRVGTWSGLIGPRGIPPDVVHKINAAVSATVNDPLVRQRLTRGGCRDQAHDARGIRRLHARGEPALDQGRARRRDHASVECEYSAIPGAGSSASRIVPVSDSVITSFEVPGR